ncbi:unnamed protein product [Camellia sinensis]
MLTSLKGMICLMLKFQLDHIVKIFYQPKLINGVLLLVRINERIQLEHELEYWAKEFHNFIKKSCHLVHGGENCNSMISCKLISIHDLVNVFYNFFK